MPDLTPTLVTGASGFLGRVVAAELLTETDVRLVLPVRSSDPDVLAAAIAAESPTLTPPEVRSRVEVVPLAPPTALEPTCRRAGIRSIVHAAGSVAYFDRDALTAGNEALTTGFLDLGRCLDVDGFTFVSTAFCAGYRDGPIPEALHDEPPEDPTAYTASKRATEHLVATSGLPWQIVRPSVVIGHSRTGRYSGRPYGIYQLWRGFERLLADTWQPVFHAVATDRPLQLVHQDAVAAGLLASLRDFRSGRITHLVSDPARLPTARQAWELWLDGLVRPVERHIHPSLDAVDRRQLPARQRLFLDFTTTNLEIAEHGWTFETERYPGPPVTLDSLRTCQDAFVAASPRLRAYLQTAGQTGRRAS